jgi:hypothetical protein
MLSPAQRLMLLVTARDDAVPLPAAAGVRSLPLAGLNREATATVWVRPRSRLGTWRRPGTLRLVARKALETEAAEVLARAVLAYGRRGWWLRSGRPRLRARKPARRCSATLTDRDSALRAAVLARLSVASAAVASPDERASLADQAATLAKKAQSPNAEIMRWTLRFRIARLHHDTRAIGEPAGQMVQWAEAYPSWDSAFALLFAESGEPERRRRHLRRLMDAGLDSLPVDSEWVELLWLLGEAAMLLDERDAARAVYDALEPYADLWAVDGYGAACFGRVTDLLARFDEYLDRPSTTPRDWAAFIRTGTVWQVEFRGRSVTVVDSKGMRDLAVLLGRPDTRSMSSIWSKGPEVRPGRSRDRHRPDDRRGRP